MSCIAAPKIGLVDVPGLPLLLGDISIPTPSIAGSFCCDFDLLDSIPITIPLGAILGPLMIAGGDAFLAVIVAIDEVIQTINDGLDLVSFDCPLD